MQAVLSKVLDLTKSEQKANITQPGWGVPRDGAWHLPVFRWKPGRVAYLDGARDAFNYLHHLRWGQLPSAGPRQKKGAGLRWSGDQAEAH
jgi:hypothetical protein